MIAWLETIAAGVAPVALVLFVSWGVTLVIPAGYVDER